MAGPFGPMAWKALEGLRPSLQLSITQHNNARLHKHTAQNNTSHRSITHHYIRLYRIIPHDNTAQQHAQDFNNNTGLVQQNNNTMQLHSTDLDFKSTT